MTSSADPGVPERFFHERFGLTPQQLERLVGSAIARRADSADLYFEFRTVQSLSLEEGIVKNASQHVAQGVGVRVVAGDRTGYAYSDDITVESLRLATRTAQAIARESGATRSVAVRPAAPAHDLYALPAAPLDVALADKVALLERIDVAARRHDPRIRNVLASLGVEQKLVLIVSAGGVAVGDVQPLVRLNVTCIAEAGGNRQQGTYGGGGRVAYDFLLDGERYLRFTRAAADQALRNLDAVAAPAPYRWFSGRAGRAFCSTRPSGTGSRETSTARRPRRSASASARPWPPRCAPWSTTARCPTAAAP
jgi:TldD protein